MHGMARFRYALGYISEVLMWLAYGACILMMLHVALDVFLRSFKISLYGTTEIVSAYYMIIIAFLPWAWVTHYNQHIAADVFTELMPPRLRVWVAVFAHALTIVFVALFTYQTYFAAVKQTRGNESWLAGIYYLPVWPSRWLLPIAGALMLLHLLLQLYMQLDEALRPRRHAG
jgi:TRAP-type C4-dicarboxylate transport system permease small subunit